MFISCLIFLLNNSEYTAFLKNISSLKLRKITYKFYSLVITREQYLIYK